MSDSTAAGTVTSNREISHHDYFGLQKDNFGGVDEVVNGTLNTTNSSKTLTKDDPVVFNPD